MAEKYRLIDLFSGCGGMTCGFVQTGSFDVVWANDFNPAALESYRANFDADENHGVIGDIVQILEQTPFVIPRADVVIGGPPCQGFSLLNKQRHGDSRRTLWYQFLHAAELAHASVIVIENVPQLLSSPEYPRIDRILAELGFVYRRALVLNAADYGVPQLRRRAFILASKEHPISLPPPTHASPDTIMNIGRDTLYNIILKPWKTVREAIGDLPPPTGTEIRNDPPPLDLHFGRNPTPVSLERYRAVPPGGNRFDLQEKRPDITPKCWIRKKTGGTDIFGRLWWNRPSVTIRTEFFKPEKGRYLHPEQHRPITHREAARLQSFPDTFRFRGTKIEIARQIGNAVPPLLARAVAAEVVRCLRKETDSRYIEIAERRLEYSAGKQAIRNTRRSASRLESYGVRRD